MAKVLALDVGEKKIGIAIGDTIFRLGFVRPALLVKHHDHVWKPLLELIREELVDRIVIGLPVSMSGVTGSQAEKTKVFAKELENRIGLPVEFRDERLTSQAVQHEQQTAGRKLKRGEEDSLAAQMLLEDYLAEQTRE